MTLTSDIPWDCRSSLCCVTKLHAVVVAMAATILVVRQWLWNIRWLLEVANRELM
jgi:hypothetical protein